MARFLPHGPGTALLCVTMHHPVRMVAALIPLIIAALFGCYTLPTAARPPAGVELDAMRATVTAWDAAGLAPMGPLCVAQMPRVRVIVAADLIPWCHAERGACLAPGYDGPVWDFDYYPILVRELNADAWRAVVHEMLHMLGACTRSGRDDFHQREELWGVDGINRTVGRDSAGHLAP